MHVCTSPDRPESRARRSITVPNRTIVLDLALPGRYVAFTSCDPVLAPPYEADETEPFPFCDFDVFVRDRLRDTTKRVTVPWNNGDPDNAVTRFRAPPRT